MFPQIKQHIIKVLGDVITVIETKSDTSELKELSNNTVHSASIYKDQDAIIIAVITYSLYKIFSNKDNLKHDTKIKLLNFVKIIKKNLKDSNFIEYNENIKKITGLIKSTDEKYSSNIGELMMKARLVKGTMLFKHGLSLSYVASLLNVSKWDLMSYVGKTRFNEVEENIGLKKRTEVFEKYLNM